MHASTVHLIASTPLSALSHVAVDALDALGILGLLVLEAIAVVLLLLTAGTLLLAALLLIPGVRPGLRWLSRRTWGTRNFHMSCWSRPVPWMSQKIVRRAEEVVGYDLRVMQFEAASRADNPEPPTSEAAKQESAVATTVAALLGRSGWPVAAGGVDRVNSSYRASDVLGEFAEAMKDIPQLRSIGPLLRAARLLVRRDLYSVRIEVLPRGRRGRRDR
jgi:hypothetical protein